MKIQELGIEEMARFGASHRVIVNFEDLNGTGTGYGALSTASAASTSGTLTPFDDMPAGTQFSFISGYLKTPFDGGATSELTAKIGYDLASGTDDDDAFLAATSLHADASYISYLPVEVADVSSASVDQTYGTEESAALTSAIAAVNSTLKSLRTVFSVAADINIVWTATGANLSTLTTGEWHLLFRRVDQTTT